MNSDRLAVRFADSFTWLLIGRIISGVGGGMLSVLTSSFLGRKFELKKRVKIDSYNFLFYSSGTFIGPVIGSLIVAWLGWRGIFFLSLGMFFVLALMLEWGIPKEEPEKEEKKQEAKFIIQSISFSLFLFCFILSIEFLVVRRTKQFRS